MLFSEHRYKILGIIARIRLNIKIRVITPNP